MTEPVWAGPPSAGERRLLDFDDASDAGVDWRGALDRMWKRRWLLGAIAMCGALAGVALSFVLPPVYQASVTMVEAGSRGSGMNSPLLSLVSDQLALPLGGRASGVVTYPEVIRSRQLLTRVLDRRYATRGSGDVRLLDRMARKGPEAQRMDLGIRRLGRRLDAAVDRRTGILTLRVRMDDPVLAAGVATAVCASLQEILVQTMNAQAGATRRFVEERLTEARAELARAEDALRAFRESNLRGSSPRLMTHEARLLRETRTQEEIVLTLTRQREIASVEEQQNLPVVSMLDPPVPPAFRSAPRRSLLGALGLMLGLTFACGWVLLRPLAVETGDGRR